MKKRYATYEWVTNTFHFLFDYKSEDVKTKERHEKSIEKYLNDVGEEFENELIHPNKKAKKVKRSRYTPWRRLWERRYSSYSFTTSALDGGEWSASRPGRAFTPGERTPGTHWTGGWVGPRAGLDTEDRGKILCPAGDRTPIARSIARH
jgi:hypothetical protein